MSRVSHPDIITGEAEVEAQAFGNCGNKPERTGGGVEEKGLRWRKEGQEEEQAQRQL